MYKRKQLANNGNHKHFAILKRKRKDMKAQKCNKPKWQDRHWERRRRTEGHTRQKNIIYKKYTSSQCKRKWQWTSKSFGYTTYLCCSELRQLFC